MIAAALPGEAMMTRAKAARARRNWDQLCELSEVLSRGSEEELVLSARGTSQPEAVEAQDALEMREQHLDLLTFTPRRHVGLGLGDVARHVSGGFVN